MTIQIGDSVPLAKLKQMTPEGAKEVSLDQLSAGKKIVVFAVPGAFTPTCSARHLPGFVDHFDEFKAKGVDAIACISVNDAYVMDAWGKSQHVDDKILMLADGSAVFADAAGLSFDASERGMGKRSQRYAMVIEDGKVTALNVEQAGVFDVSSAEAILALL